MGHLLLSQYLQIFVGFRCSLPIERFVTPRYTLIKKAAH